MQSFPLRMPPELRIKIEEAAKKNHRSTNAELAARLEASFNPLANIPLDGDTKHALEREAWRSGRTLDAELAQRLAVTRQLDIVLGGITKGDHNYATAVSWITHLNQEVLELQEAVREAEQNPLVLDGAQIADEVAKKIRAPELETVTAVLALASFFPEAITDEHRTMLRSASSQIAGAESSDPKTAITYALKQLLAHITLRERGI